MDQDAKQRFGDYIDMIRDNLDFAHFTTTEQLLDAILGQIVSMMLEGDISLAASATQQDSEVGPLDAIVEKIDEIRAEELFFKANRADLVFLPSETYYMGTMTCSVRIFARGTGAVMFDPGGVFYLRFAATAELMAVAGEEMSGNVFTWEWDQGNHNDFYSQENRAYFRAVEYETANVRVTLQSGFGTQCQAVLRVIMQGGFPDMESN